MTTDAERINEANSWNNMWIGFLIEHMEKVKSSLETFTDFGNQAKHLIEKQIQELECIENENV